MRNLWLIAVAAALGGVAAARADVVIGYKTPVATAPMPVGPAACGAPCGQGDCGKECKPSLRDRLRSFRNRSSCDAPCAPAACAPVAKPCPPAQCAPACKPAPCESCKPARCKPARCESCKPEKGCGAKCGRPFLERLKDWLCYRPMKCCNEPAANCGQPPLYTYFIDDCTQGPGCTQPVPACCDKPGLWKRMCGSGHKMFSSPAGHGCGAGTGCLNGGCSVR
jgi:hypothetical protein